MEDGEAVDLVRRGDRRGPEALLTKYQMSVYNLTLRMLGNPADAEDATQEVLLKAFQRIDQYRPAEAFGGWLHGIARHHAIDVIRRRRALPSAVDAAPFPDVEAAALAAIDRQLIQDALQRLATRDRALLVLRYWEDQPIDAIARIMHMSEGAVKVALVRARRALAALITSPEVKINAV